MPTKQSSRPIDISYKVFVKFFLVVGAVVALYAISHIVASLLFAVVIASAIEPAILWLRKYKTPRLLGVIIIYLIVLSIFAGVFLLLVPVLVDEYNAFDSSVIELYQARLFSELNAFDNIPFLRFVSENAELIIENGYSQLGQITGSAVGIASAVFGGLFSLIILAVVSFYLAAQEGGIENFLRLITPLEYEEYLIDLWTRSQKKMGQWLRAQLLLGVLIGVMVFISLTLLGVQYALLLAMLAMIFEIIPIIGPILAAVPAVLIALIQKPILGLVIVLVYFFIQQIESHLIVPVVMRRAIGLNPLVVIIALLVGAKLGGILGLLLAVPLMSALVEFVVDIDKKKRGLFQQHASGT
ncbi:MAG: AI-2E family transporter [Candidatus Sungbacteria bacterium]|nr:AI-2E family transporter [Candidatus Sungbacteria bacterium]